MQEEEHLEGTSSRMIQRCSMTYLVGISEAEAYPTLVSTLDLQFEAADYPSKTTTGEISHDLVPARRGQH